MDSSNFRTFHKSDFIIKSFVGRGGFGSVYKARHKDFMCDVAIKVFAEGKSISDRDKRRAEKEAAKLSFAGYQFVIGFHGICITDKFYGLVMRYAENGSLKSVLKQIEVPWPLRARILHEIALGINFLHLMKPPMIHADLKASNVLLDIDFRAKVSDFGLSFFYHQFLPSTSGRAFAGTTTHMPPESFKPDYNLTVEYDSFSFAILIWEVITRMEPFTTPSSASTKSVLSNTIIQCWIEIGHRPDLQLALEACPPEISKVLHLMQDCWNEEFNKRPHFKKCISVLEPLKDQLINSIAIEDVIKYVRTELNKNEAATTSMVENMGDLALDAIDLTRSRYGSSARNSPRHPIEETHSHGNQGIPGEFGGTDTNHPINLQPGNVLSPQSYHQTEFHVLEPNPSVVIHHKGPLHVGDSGAIHCQQQMARNQFHARPVQPQNPLLLWDNMEPRIKLKLSESIADQWPKLAKLLGLEKKINTIKTDYKYDGVEEQAYQMFLSWQQKESKNATSQALADALNEIYRGDVITKFL